MMDTATGPVEIFYSYAPEDEPLQQELANALGLLRRQERIREWSSRDMLGGDERQQMVLAHLEAAHVILLLISDNFINSDQCYNIELPRALERQEAGTRVIPILLRPVVGWEGTRFATLQPIPRNGKAVTSWPNRDEAFAEVAGEISAAIEQVAPAASSPAAGTSRRGRASTGGVHDAHDDRSRLWNIPYPQNPFFTGRDATLKQVHSALRAGKATAVTQPQAFSGLGGIGKTQLAIEYAYRYRADYQMVLWARADSREALVSGFTDIARLLDLPEKDAQNQDIIVAAWVLSIPAQPQASITSLCSIVIREITKRRCHSTSERWLSTKKCSVLITPIPSSYRTATPYCSKRYKTKNRPTPKRVLNEATAQGVAGTQFRRGYRCAGIGRSGCSRRARLRPGAAW